ncbi:MAG: VacJ family lipoprotein [Gammaproteobacteria bacterium]|nr:MAG: VacJ family lipoprotein [Gammaproteobacteria bacterium]
MISKHIARNQYGASKLIIILLASVMALLQSACAATGSTKKNIDPFEPINRPIYKFNDITDRYLLRPLGQGYNAILPRPVRNGVGNFYDNITYPVTIVNGFLQGKFEQATRDTVRFIANSTFGLLGFFDVASPGGLARHDEDFGQTFARWGIPQGPYIVIPLLGPSTVRDGIGILGNVQVNPLIQMSNTSVRDKLLILWYIESRAALIGPDEVIQDAFDPYLFVRDAYLQNRQFLINDSTTPVGEFFEDDFEDEFGEEFNEGF